jgi:hypothetical protein
MSRDRIKAQVNALCGFAYNLLLYAVDNIFICFVFENCMTRCLHLEPTFRKMLILPVIVISRARISMTCHIFILASFHMYN